MIWANGCDQEHRAAMRPTFPIRISSSRSAGGTTAPEATNDQKIGTFIHELGHDLGLHHGSVDDVNYKPNHLSVMN